MLVGRQIAKRHVVVSSLLDLARTRDSDAITVKQQPRHQHRMVRRQPSPIPPFIAAVNRRQIQFVHYVSYESCQVILRQPVLQRRRKQKWLIVATHSKTLVHQPIVQNSPSGVCPFLVQFSNLSPTPCEPVTRRLDTDGRVTAKSSAHWIELGS